MHWSNCDQTLVCHQKMKALVLHFTLLLSVSMPIGFCQGEIVSVHYHASGVVLNHNFTKDFFLEDQRVCRPCNTLANDIKTGFWKMFDFFVKANLFGDSSLLNKASEGVFFRPPSVGGPDINGT
ncbi:uncharacterized protein LOC111342645 [Stylophora pistillata]|uniref:uncharacterized protein LOC111342645 n=1 Tax=Stylophora pistillata TaxID=50429 RepID=UPI000C039F75|nr:uncharacterized protein LOC111342645 [Stylophora pistillata]